MPSLDSLARWLVILGVTLIVIGGFVWLVNRVPALRQLPGTLQISMGGITCVIPLLASIVLSVVLTLVLNVLARILKH